MTLNEWSEIADRKPYQTLALPNVFWIPDTIQLQDSGMRSLLWSLSDYLVSSVTGGTIWLVKR